LKDKVESDQEYRRIILDGYSYKTKSEFWDDYTDQIPIDSVKCFGKNLDAFSDAITGGGPGFPGNCSIEIIGIKKLTEIFGKSDMNLIIDLLKRARFVDSKVEE